MSVSDDHILIVDCEVGFKLICYIQFHMDLHVTLIYEVPYDKIKWVQETL